MTDCKSKCGYNFKSYKYFSHEFVPYDYSPGSFAGDGADIGINHPDYTKLSNCWQLMRDAVKGEEAVKENAFEREYILVPAGLLDEKDKDNCTREARHYIERGRFPEVPLRHLLEVEGQLFGDTPVFEGPDALVEIADDLDSKGLSLENFARHITKEYFKVFREGVYIQYNEDERRPEFVRYPAERIVNWKIGTDGFPRLIVIEEQFDDETNLYSHETKSRRIQLAIEDDRFTYRVFILEDQEWTEDLDAATIPTRNGSPLERIPFVLFGDWADSPPPLKPIVSTTLDYYRAHVEWAHSLFYSAHPTLYANIDEGGAILSADVDDSGQPLPYSIDIGACHAHVFQKGILAYAEVSGAGLSALKDRVTETRDELAGLGARSFINYSASNVAALTESLQQSGERGVLASFARDIGLKITECLVWAAEWMGLPTDEIDFHLDESQDDTDFDLRVLPQVFELVDRGVIGNTRIRHFIRCVEPKLTGGLTDEEIDREILEEGAGFSSADILGGLPDDSQ